MTTKRDPALIAMVAGLGLVSSMLLGGCAFLPGAAVQNRVSPTDSSPGDPSSSAQGTGDGGDSADAPEESGDGDAGSDDSLARPANLPDDLPIIDGTVVVSEDLGTGWAIWIAVPDATDGYHEAEQQLAGAGFTEDATMGNAADGWYSSFSRADYGVQLTAKDDSGDAAGPIVAYTIYANQ